MTPPPEILPRDAATVFVVRDVLKSVEHYRDVLGFRTEFTYGQPTFYAGVERDNVTLHLQAVNEPKDHPYGMRDFDIEDPDGNRMCFGMASQQP